MRVLTAALACLILLSDFAYTADYSSHETIKVRADGYAEGSGPRARAEALSMAEAEAFDILLHELVPKKYANKLTPIVDILHSYIRTSRPIQYETVPGGTTVFAEVYLYEQQLKRDIASILTRDLTSKPNVLLLMAEELGGVSKWSVASPGSAEQEIAAKFEVVDFIMLDREDLRRRYSAKELAGVVLGGREKIAHLGRENRVDIVVVGQAVSKLQEGSTTGNAARFHGHVSIDIVRATDGAYLESLEAEAVVASASPAMGGKQALVDATHKVAKDALVAVVLGFISEPKAKSIWLTVDVPDEGIWLSKVLRDIKKALSGKKVEELRHSGSALRFRISYEGTLKKLVDTLTQLEPEGYSLKVVEAAGKELKLNVVPR